MIHPHIRQHFYYYTIMGILQLTGFFVILAASPHVQTQMLLVVFTTCVYFLWAMLHQYVHHDIHPKVVVEYVLVSCLGISISYFMFQMQ